MPNRNSETLMDFVNYCAQNPELRFWQALRAWAGVNFIFFSAHPIRDIEEALGSASGLSDTFYRSGK